MAVSTPTHILRTNTKDRFLENPHPKSKPRLTEVIKLVLVAPLYYILRNPLNIKRKNIKLSLFLILEKLTA